MRKALKMKEIKLKISNDSFKMIQNALMLKIVGDKIGELDIILGRIFEAIREDKDEIVIMIEKEINKED
jgi:aspartokinase